MASLRDDFEGFRCGAVLIQDDAVITAASCVDPLLNNGFPISEVLLGGFFQETPVERHSVAAIFPHGQFNGDVRNGYNLAIIKFAEQTCLQPIPFVGREAVDGENYVILGFGRTGPVDPFSQSLLTANVTNYDISVCNAAGVMPAVDDQQICTQTAECGCGSICEGDEGGPLVYRPTETQFVDTLMGVISHSSGNCSQEGTYGIHTDILPHLNWMRTTLESPLFLEA